ncbi:hypothetical protein F4775DRAFT_331083 [Biscogniauxia sp. FL1348]|nr:hypothetical protein F4775DRAFT_331083 [Biscogniauxia sp. FL1348]
MAGISLGLSSVPFVPVTFGILGASLICLPLNTAWVHATISAPGSRPFWPRLPDLKTTYRAAALPTLVNCFAAAVAHGVPHVIVPGSSSLTDKTCRGLVALALGLLLDVLLVIPSHVVLTRVQASLLPADAKTIVPFRRPGSAYARGYLSMKEAWESISTGSWARIAKLYAKTFVAAVAVEVVVFTLMLLEVAIIVYLKT